MFIQYIIQEGWEKQKINKRPGKPLYWQDFKALKPQKNEFSDQYNLNFIVKAKLYFSPILFLKLETLLSE